MPSNRRELLALSGAILAATAGCIELPASESGSDIELDASAQRVDPDVGTDELDSLVRGNTQFAFEMHDAIVDAEPDADHFVSPFSISIALAMTYAGARGDTAETMADTLHFALEQADLHPAFNALDQTLEEREDPDDGTVKLNIANALWPREGLTLREEFLDTMAAQYGARPVELDFGSEPEKSRETINEWVADKTEGKIDELIPEGELNANPPLVLTNAIYFLGDWLEEFDEGDTYNTEFTTLEGGTGGVSMMSQSESFPYAEVDGHQLIELPYVGEETSMVVLLPAQGAFETFETELDAARLDELLTALDEQHGQIDLPRFELETSYVLPDVLEELGMGVAFSGEADFSGMVEGGGLFIDNVLHDAFVAVDEEGTEAAAATGVSMGDSAGPSKQFEMIVDRPFLFLIRDRPTDAVLFLGRVVDVPDDP